MQQSPPGTRARLSQIVRAAAIEVASSPEPADPEYPGDPVPRESEDAKALRDLLRTLDRQIEELRGRRRQTIGEVAALSVEVGVALAERLLCADIGADRQRLDRIVRQALERLPATASVTVRAHPDDIALLQRQLADQEDLQGCHEALNFRPDGALARGQLRLEAGEFFVAWDTANGLAELRAALLETNFMDE